MAIGQNIAELRKAKNLTQRELADKLGVSQSHVARWETERSQPREKALEELAAALDASVEEIRLGGKDSLKIALDIEDKELLSLLQELKNLSSTEVEALKTVLRGLLSRSRIEQSLQA